MFLQLLSILAPVYLCVALGFFWQRLGRRVDNELIADLCTKIGAPCLVFSSLVRIDVEYSALVELAGAAILAHACMALFGLVALRLLGLPREAFLAPVIFANSGNMGFPVCLFAFGETGLSFGVVYFSISAVLHFTVGQWIWSGKASMQQLLRTPLSYAVVLAVVVMSFGLEMPTWLMRTTENLGAFTVPLMQLTLGISLAEFRIESLGRSVIVSCLRLGLGAGVGAGIATLFGMEGIARGVLILDCAMPVAVVNYLFAVQHDRAPDEVASIVVISTMLSFLSLPLLLFWVL